MEPEERFFVYLAGDVPEAGAAELRSLLAGQEGVEIKPLTDRLFLIKGALDIATLWHRMALIKWAGRIHAELPGLEPESLRRVAWERIVTSKEVLIALHGFQGQVKSPIEELILSAIKERGNAALLRPSRAEQVIHLFRTPSSYYVGTSGRPPRRRWLDRRPRARPFFHPVALHPRLARLMVNLAGPLGNAVLLDPFCGTGSILIEAAILGLRALGSDLSLRMCKGALLNARHAGLTDIDIIQADARNMPLREVGAIVTDLPYGRASSLHHIKAEELIGAFLTEAGRLLVGGSSMVLLYSHDLERYVRSGEFLRVQRFRIPVHRRLTRILAVLKKS